jgi:hypothetical protein
MNRPKEEALFEAMWDVGIDDLIMQKVLLENL